MIKKLFTILGDVGGLVTGLLCMAFGVLAGLNLANYVLAFVFCGACIACLIVAGIFGKLALEDTPSEGFARTRRKYLGVFEKLFFNGLFEIIYALAIIALIVIGIFNLVAPDSIEGFGALGCLLGGIAAIIGFGTYSDTIHKYCERHCKYCGSSFAGGGYEYEEQERSASYNSNNDKVELTSKIRFEFTCPACERSTIFWKKMKTDAERIEKYADKVVGRR